MYTIYIDVHIEYRYMVASVMFFFLKMFMKKKFVALQIKPIFSYQKYFNQSQKIFLPKKNKINPLKIQ